MNRSIAAAVLLAFSLPPLAVAEPTKVSPVTLPHTTQFDLTSKAGETYRIFVGEPLNATPSAGAPVVYVLDGNPNFPAMLSAVHRGEPASATLVVAVGYPTDDPTEHSRRRYFDLTSEADAEWIATQPPHMRPERTGGREAFLNFILNELRPEIDRRYPTDPKRQALFGHSLGGLFVLYAYLTEPEAFTIYGASSPSIWWNDRDILEQEEAFVAAREGSMPSSTLIVTAGEKERPGAETPKERAALLASRRQVENSRELVDRLKSSLQGSGSIRFEELAGENHGSALLPASNRTARALIQAADRIVPPKE